jgi:ADP-heptose:LPS heptosyltransferase
MGERSRTRAMVVAGALRARLARRAAPEPPRRILIAHSLLLGDVIMLTPLVARLRAQHPSAQIALLASPAHVPLYSGRPYGVRALPFRPAEERTTRALLREEPFDLAFVPGDNRYSWVAAAMGARRIVAHSGDPARLRNLFVDEKVPYSRAPAAWGDMVAELAGGDEPPPYRRHDWPAPDAAPFDRPHGRYAVLHVGASTPLKHWPAARWSALAATLASRGLEVAWSAGRGEEPLVAAADPAGRFASYAGRLDLPQMWALLANASLLVAPDTGISHLGRATWTPTVTIFGPGSSVLCDRGRFWRDTPWCAATFERFPCRDQRLLFAREIEWVRRCSRNIPECPRALCMEAVGLEQVLAAIETVQVRT